MLRRSSLGLFLVATTVFSACAGGSDSSNTSGNSSSGGGNGGASSSSGNASGSGNTSGSSSSTASSSSGNVPADPMGLASLTTLTTDLASDDMGGREEGSAGGNAARAYIKDYFSRCNLLPAGTDGYDQPITVGTGTNIIGKIQGTDPVRNERHIIISAHYDHLGMCGGDICNGANDNAAGVAMVMAIACELNKAPPARSVLAIAWDSEEPPTFLTSEMGSSYWVNNPTVALNTVDVAIVLDLVGADLWPGYNGHFLLGGELSPEVKAAIDAQTVPSGLLGRRLGLHLAEVTQAGMQPWSDYDAFRDHGLPFLFLSNGQNEQYHTTEDEVGFVNFPKMVLQTAYLADIVDALGNNNDAPTFMSTGNDYTTDANNIHSVLTEALAPGGLVDTLSLTNSSEQALQGDLTRIEGIRTRLNGGSAPTGADVNNLRRAVQRVMCLAGDTYSEATCSFL